MKEETEMTLIDFAESKMNTENENYVCPEPNVPTENLEAISQNFRCETCANRTYSEEEASWWCPCAMWLCSDPKWFCKGWKMKNE